MNTPNVDAGRLERRVRRVGRDTMPWISGFCSLFPFGAIRGGAAIAPYGPTITPYRVTITPYRVGTLS